MGVAIPIPRNDSAGESQRRLQRIRTLAWVFDRSIPIGRWRIGLDPILGILPGAGDGIGALISLYVVYESARLGAPPRLLARMGGNILLEAIVGMVPVVGDLFDFAWKANSRNLALIEHHYRDGIDHSRDLRSMRQIWTVVVVICIVVLLAVTGLVFLVLKVLNSLLE